MGAMLKVIISVAGCLYVAALLGEGEAIRCYHCYESFNTAVTLRNSGDNSSEFVRCNKDKNNWNTWNCPTEYPICVVLSGKVKGHTEILRTCGEKDLCLFYKPPPGVTLETCRECNATLCNDYLQVPNPDPTVFPPPPPPNPVDPDASFIFNININLNLIRYGKTNKGLK